MRPSASSVVGVPRMTHRRVRKDREEALGSPTEAMNHFAPVPETFNIFNTFTVFNPALGLLEHGRP
jgi:hypothetical protein